MSPEYSAETKKKITEMVSRYPKKEAALLPVLHLTQREFGAITPAEEKLVAGLLGIKPIRVREAVTFYTMLTRKPLGKYFIQVCSNLSCSLTGGERILGYLRKKLGIEPGATTEDGRFSLATVECLGACDRGPCLMVNDDYHENLTEERVDQILESLK